jgi:uncharacterized protein YyaL (SSP411 family)
MQDEFQPADLELAQALAGVLLEQFEDPDAGGFYFTGREHEKLIHRPKPGHDNATPSGNAVAAWALGRLAFLTGEARHARAAERTLELFYPLMREYPAGFAAMAIALDEQLVPPRTLILTGEPDAVRAWQTDLAREFLPDLTLIAAPRGTAGLPKPLARPPRPEPVNGWLCRGVTCLSPMNDLVNLKKALKEAA